MLGCLYPLIANAESQLLQLFFLLILMLLLLLLSTTSTPCSIIFPHPSHVSFSSLPCYLFCRPLFEAIESPSLLISFARIIPLARKEVESKECLCIVDTSSNSQGYLFYSSPELMNPFQKLLNTAITKYQSESMLKKRLSIDLDIIPSAFASCSSVIRGKNCSHFFARASNSLTLLILSMPINDYKCLMNQITMYSYAMTSWRHV